MYKKFKIYQKCQDGVFRTDSEVYTTAVFNKHREVVEWLDDFMWCNYRADYRHEYDNGFVYRWEDEIYLVELMN